MVRSVALDADVKINRTGIGKAVRGAGDDILSAVPAIPDLISRGERIGKPEPPRNPTEAISTKAWHLLGGVVRIDGRDVRMFANIREDHAGHFFYNLGTGEGGAGHPTKAGWVDPEGPMSTSRGSTPESNVDSNPAQNKSEKGGLKEDATYLRPPRNALAAFSRRLAGPSNNALKGM